MTKGNTELREKIVGLARTGMRPKTISETLDCDAPWTRAVINRARASDPTIPRHNSGPRSDDTIALTVSIDILSRLQLPAAARGLTPRECARRIILRAVHDDLVDAILDDHPEQETPNA